MLSNEVEFQKAFIRDTVSTTPLSRSDVIISLALARDIDPPVFKYLHENKVSAPALDFIANLPANKQHEIINVVIAGNIGVHAAIALVTEEFLSDDAVYAAELSAAWQKASEAAREMFLKGIGASILKASGENS